MSALFHTQMLNKALFCFQIKNTLYYGIKKQEKSIYSIEFKSDIRYNRTVSLYTCIIGSMITLCGERRGGDCRCMGERLVSDMLGSPLMIQRG